MPADDDSTDPVTEEAGTSRQVIGVLVGLAVVAIVGATLLVGLRKSG